MVKISVIVPVYNVEKYLDKCLKSLVNQTFDDYEIIIVNDGSKDNSQKIIDKYKKKYKKLIKSYTKENGGLSSTRNYGFERCNGEYILFVDSDDYIAKNTLKYCYEYAIKENADIVHFDVIRVYEDSDKEIRYSLFNKMPTNKKDYFLSVPSACNKLIKKDLMKNNNINFTEGLWFEDLAFCHKIILKANKNVYLNKNLYYYLERSNSIMKTPNILKNLDLITDYEDSMNYLKQNNLYNEIYSELEFSVIERMLISGITRVIKINGDKEEKREVIRKYKKFVNDNFKNYRENNYIKDLSSKRKIILYLVEKDKYWLIKMLLFLSNIIKR